MRAKSLGWTCLVLIILLSSPLQGEAQVFKSGSTGSLGAFAPASNTTVTLPSNGILNYTTVTIPAGITVTFAANATNTPVTMLATGDVTINGTVNVDGQPGIGAATSGAIFNAGGLGGPGGFSGGNGGSRGSANNIGAGGQGPGGGISPTGAGVWGAPGYSAVVNLLPLFGGSGGAGGSGDATYSGSSGGGGGGAIVIASTKQITISSTGIITANGGRGGWIGQCVNYIGGGGSGGSIRIVAPKVTNAGTIRAIGGQIGCSPGIDGRVRIESFITGTLLTTTPAPSVVSSPGPINSASVPALVNLPTVTISTVAGVTAPANPGGTYTLPDITLPVGTTNPVTVVITATNTPVPLVSPGKFSVRVIPQFAATPAPSDITTITGTFTSSTGSTTVTLPADAISLLNVYGVFNLP